ncbi:MAG: hypothetical protein KatS3mg054_0085 [Chloroflexus sp.]|nr:MAG: hypothetical protein KatS3mg054_0085 [Chloroflexus sp.]
MQMRANEKATNSATHALRVMAFPTRLIFGGTAWTLLFYCNSCGKVAAAYQDDNLYRVYGDGYGVLNYSCPAAKPLLAGEWPMVEDLEKTGALQEL